MAFKILIVDDSAADRLIIEKMLNDFDTIVAADGIEAFQKLDEYPDIRLIILDLNMPAMDGYEVLTKLKSNHKFDSVHTIILTNYDEVQNEIKGLQMGAIDYIRKPINLESLRARIEVHTKLIQIQHIMEQRLYEQKITFDRIFDQSPVGIGVSFNSFPTNDELNPYFKVNPSFEKILGYSKEEVRKLGWAYITHPEDLEPDLKLFAQLQAGQIDHYTIEKRFIKPDKSIVWVHLTVSRLILDPNLEYNHICIAQDITERKLIEEQLTKSERSKAILLSHLPGLAFRCLNDEEYTMQFVSEGSYNLTGFQASSFINNKDLSFRKIIAPEYLDYVHAYTEEAIKKHTSINIEYEIITANRMRKWVLELGEALYDSKGQVEAVEGIIIDITDRKASETMLKYNNEHDAWTGLFNRRSLEMDLEKDRQENNETKRVLISVNLNAIQSLTALYGFHYSQELIRKVAEMLIHYEFPNRQVYRTYESRFSIYWKNYGTRRDIEAFCSELERKLSDLLVVERIGGSLGVVEINPDEQVDSDVLLKQGLNASERAMEISNREFVTYFYDNELQKQLDREKYIGQELNRSINEDGDNLYLMYQPVVNLDTNKIHGFEALARFTTSNEEPISPNEFIPIAEKTKLINPLGKIIIQQALAFSKRLTSEGYNDITVSVNISIIQLLRHDFVSSLFEMIQEAGVDPHLIGIELTETVFVHNFDVVNRILDVIQQAGLQVAIDDFGKGYSSLARECDLNIKYLKIDKFFIDKLMHIDPESAITSDIISMAHKLGHCVIAEGVEHESQRQFLINHHCDKMQGFLFSRPVLPDKALALLKKHH